MTHDALIHLEERFGAHNYHPIPVVLSRGLGVWVYDVEGHKYLDMMSAYSAVSHGHCHPRLVEAARQQMARLCVCSRAYHNDQMPAFLERLCTLFSFDRALPMNSGAEAVETALKAMRRWGYEVKKIPDQKAEIIVCSGNFHGRTLGIISFSSDEDYQKNFGPFLPGFRMVPFGDIEAVRAAITPYTCGILVEPIQGEAGIVLPPDGFLKNLRTLCNAHNILWIADEIQSGLGRTGKLLACDHEGVKPDGVLLGKALGGGILPVSAFLAHHELMDVFIPGSHGSTFGGNPLAAAVGTEALNVLVEEKLCENSATLGAYLKERVQALNSPVIKEVRGRGLWIGIEINPSQISARQIAENLMKHGILSKETHETVIRLAPPLIITKKQIDDALTILEKVFCP